MFRKFVLVLVAFAFAIAAQNYISCNCRQGYIPYDCFHYCQRLVTNNPQAPPPGHENTPSQQPIPPGPAVTAPSPPPQSEPPKRTPKPPPANWSQQQEPQPPGWGNSNTSSCHDNNCPDFGVVGRLPPGWGDSQYCPHGNCAFQQHQQPQHISQFGCSTYGCPDNCVDCMACPDCSCQNCHFQQPAPTGYGEISWGTPYQNMTCDGCPNNDCSTCGGYNLEEIYNDHYPGYMRISSEVKRVILSTMPQIPVNHGNMLYFAEAGFVRYIISKHKYLPALLDSMVEPVIYRVLQYVPNLDYKISTFTAEWIQSIFKRVNNQCELFNKFSKKNQDVVVFKVPQLSSCRPATTAAPTINPEAYFENWEIAGVETKIPKFRLLVSIMNPASIKRAKEVVPNVMKCLLNLPKEVYTDINEFLDTYGENTKLMEPKKVVGKLFGKSKDLNVSVLKSLFI